jgi:hypothetical protein
MLSTSSCFSSLFCGEHENNRQSAGKTTKRRKVCVDPQPSGFPWLLLFIFFLLFIVLWVRALFGGMQSWSFRRKDVGSIIGLRGSIMGSIIESPRARNRCFLFGFDYHMRRKKKQLSFSRCKGVLHQISELAVKSSYQ